MKYYVYEKGQQAGPFSIDELKKKSLNIHTPVWKEGMLDWEDAGTVDELAVLFSASRSKKESQSEAKLPATLLNNSNQQTLNVGRIAAWSALVVVLIIGGWSFLFKNTGPGALQASAKTVEDSRLSYLAKEQKNPSQYITGKFKSQETIKGQRAIVLELHNNATLANFKDIVLNVTYLSKDGSELGSELLTVTETLTAGQSLSTSIKTNAPGVTSDVKVMIEGAGRE